MKFPKIKIVTQIIALLAVAFASAGCLSNSRTNALFTAEKASAKEVESNDLLKVKTADNVPSQIKEYTGFTLSFNEENRTPNWVAWELLDSETEGPVTRSNKFWYDWEIKGCPRKDEYKHSGYSRGHLCPAADMKWSEDAMNDCFSMANMAPQLASLNSGAWNKLEDKERKWAKKFGKVVIIAGPIYESADKKTIGDGIRVPSAFYKIFLTDSDGEIETIGFVYPNQKTPGKMIDYALTVREIERITGLDFFYTLPQEVQDKMENNYNSRLWIDN